MIFNTEQQLQPSFHKFSSIKARNEISKKMLAKLQFLSMAIKEQNPSLAIIQQLSEIQKLSLKELNRQNKIVLFNSIIECQSHRQDKNIDQYRRAFMKKEQTFSRWSECIVDFSPPLLIISRDRLPKEALYTLQILKMSISKHYRQQKKKFLFGIIYQDNKYSIAYAQETHCKHLHQDILNYIRQVKKKKESQIIPSSIIQEKEAKSSIVSIKLQFQREEAIYDDSYRQFDQKEYFEEEEHDFFSKVQRLIFSEFIQDKKEYHLLKNVQNGRITKTSNQQYLRVSLIIRNSSLCNAVQAYLKLNVWNKQVQSFRVLNEVRKNSFLAHIIFKKGNLFDLRRESYLIVTYLKTCPCFLSQSQRQSLQGDREKAFRKDYLLIKSISLQDYQHHSNTIDLDQTVEFAQLSQNGNKFILVNIKSKIDYKQYNLFGRNKKMHVMFFDYLSEFVDLCPQKPSSALFQYGFCFCPRKRRGSSDSMNSSSGSLKVNSKIRSSHREEDEETEQSEKHRAFKPDQVVKILEDLHDKTINRNILYFLKDKAHENYYLRHRFSQQYSFSESQLLKQQERDYLLQKGLWKMVNNELIYCNQEAIQLQKDIIKIMLKKAGSYLYKGKSIMNLSLPVQIFADKSMLAMLADMMGFFPKFIQQALNTKNLLEQIKNVATSFVFTSSCFPDIQKPFNPILGETFQGIIGNIPIYLEQISHHPPISALFMKTKDFQAFGNFDFHVEMGLNSAYSKMSSLFTVRIFKTKTQYLIKLPDLQIGGTLFGDRILRQVGLCFVYQRVNNVYCQYNIGKDKKKVYQSYEKLKINEVIGGIYKVTHSFGQEVENINKKTAFKGVTQDDIIETYSTLRGNWFGDLSFDGKQYKSFQKGPFPLKIKRQTYLLPSDSLFRLDIIYKWWKWLQKSNSQKESLQNMQRRDKLLREHK